MFASRNSPSILRRTYYFRHNKLTVTIVTLLAISCGLWWIYRPDELVPVVLFLSSLLGVGLARDPVYPDRRWLRRIRWASMWSVYLVTPVLLIQGAVVEGVALFFGGLLGAARH